MLLIDISIFIFSLFCLISAAYFLTFSILFLIIHKFRKYNAFGQKKIIQQCKFLIIIPAHNEEKVLPRLLNSIAKIKYPSSLLSCYVICDNCKDNTEKIAKESGLMVIKRINRERQGKGYAIEWALNRINIQNFDVVIMTDADTIFDKNALNELNIKFADENIQVIQCYNGVINPNETPFTRLIALARALEIIYMTSRSYLGLTVPLIGNGMCFRSSILKKYPWSAFSISEDLEYFCMLSVNGIRIDYSYLARIFLQEEKKFSHAKTQRERWSSGKFQLIIKYVPKILWSGLKKGSIKNTEAFTTLFFPNPSLLGNILVIILILSLILQVWLVSKILILVSFLILFFCFISSFLIVKIDKNNLLSLLLIPNYLLWKGLIDFRAILGKKKDKWEKTERH